MKILFENLTTLTTHSLKVTVTIIVKFIILMAKAAIIAATMIKIIFHAL